MANIIKVGGGAGGGADGIPIGTVVMPIPSAEENGNLYRYAGKDESIFRTGEIYLCEELESLPTPVFTISDHKVVITPVENASSYELWIDDEYMLTTRSETINLMAVEGLSDNTQYAVGIRAIVSGSKASELFTISWLKPSMVVTLEDYGSYNHFSEVSKYTYSAFVDNNSTMSRIVFSLPSSMRIKIRMDVEDKDAFEGSVCSYKLDTAPKYNWPSYVDPNVQGSFSYGSSGPMLVDYGEVSAGEHFINIGALCDDSYTGSNISYTIYLS